MKMTLVVSKNIEPEISNVSFVEMMRKSMYLQSYTPMPDRKLHYQAQSIVKHDNMEMIITALYGRKLHYQTLHFGQRNEHDRGVVVLN